MVADMLVAIDPNLKPEGLPDLGRSSWYSNNAMPKRTKKLLVYLDQNFISEMAKADFNDRVKQEWKGLYELLKEGFLDEKLVVPQSWFHDIETSLAPVLKALKRRYNATLLVKLLVISLSRLRLE